MGFPNTGIKSMPTGRRFGNESNRHAPLIPDTLELQTQSRIAAAAAAAQSPLVPQPAPFPYPSKYVIAFTNASGGEIFVPVAGYAVSFWDSTNITDVVQVRYARGQGDIAGPQIPFRPGHALGLGDYTWLGLQWSAIAGATGTLLFLPRGVLLDENR